MSAAPSDPDRKVSMPASVTPVSSTTSGGDSTGPWDDEAKRTFVNKEISEYFDPCQEKARASLRCLRRNDGDRSYCGDYFQ
jgi:cytochrome c oxidase assembly protein subunit 23